jgi:hypothetical protein
MIPAPIQKRRSAARGVLTPALTAGAIDDAAAFRHKKAPDDAGAFKQLI